MDSTNKKYIFDELAEKIRKKIFVFENIVSIDNRSIQRITNIII